MIPDPATIATVRDYVYGSGVGNYGNGIRNDNYKNGNRGLSNTDKGIVGQIWSGLTALLAAYNTVQAIEIAKKQFDIAKMYLRMAQDWHDYHKNSFEPIEDIELQEAKEFKIDEPIYDTRIGRAQTLSHIKYMGRAYNEIKCTSEYCTGLRNKRIRDAFLAEARDQAQMAGLGYRTEQAYIQQRDELRWRMLMNVVRRGRGLQAQPLKFASLSYDIYGDQRNMTLNGMNDALYGLGWMKERRATDYPGLWRIERPNDINATRSNFIKRTAEQVSAPTSAPTLPDAPNRTST